MQNNVGNDMEDIYQKGQHCFLYSIKIKVKRDKSVSKSKNTALLL